MDLNRPGVTILDAHEWSWTWDETTGKFLHERQIETATLEEILALGPATVAFDITLADLALSE